MKIREMTFGPKHDNDDDYLFHPENIYEITKFQRPYTWGEFQLNGVFQDIQHVLETGEAVGWPSMLIQQSDGGHNTQNFDLGDGQQRTTTVFLILTAVWHKWRKDFLIPGEANEQDFFNRLFNYDARQNGRGLLGGQYESKIVTAIKFQTPSAYRDIKGLFDTDVLDDEALASIKNATSGEQESKQSQLYRNFLLSWDKLNIYSESEKELREIAEILLEKIVFPVVEYKAHENMFRAFANINSFGEPLTQSELVKAEIFGRVKSVDPELANEIADYWNDVMEPWFRLNSKHDMDWFLTHEFNIFNNWNHASKRDPMTEHPEKHRFLKMRWQEYFDTVSAQLDHDEDELVRFYKNDFFKNMKNHFRISKYLLSNEHYPVGSVEWEMQYTKYVFEDIDESILFYLSDVLSKKELIKTLRILRRFALYAYLRRDQTQRSNIARVLTVNASPIKQIPGEELTYSDIEKFLISHADGKGIWLDKSELEEIIKKESYVRNYNRVFSNLFVFINNENLIADNYHQEQSNTSYFRRSTREHIIPTTPRGVELSDGLEQDDYHRYINRIGNVLVLYGKDNSKIGNDAVKDKIAVYKKSENVTWGRGWIQDFIEDYNEDEDLWNDPSRYKEAIDKRSEKLAEIIAPYICRPNDNGLDLEDKNKGEIISITISDNHGNEGTDQTITGAFTSYLEQFLEDPKVRQQIRRDDSRRSVFARSDRNLVLAKDFGNDITVKGYAYFKQDRMDEVIEEINTRFEGYTAQIVVERAEVDDNIEEKQDEAFENDSEYDDIVDFAVRAPFEELLKVINK